VLHVKYVTLQSLIRQGIARNADQISRFSPDSVYPILKAEPLADSLRICVTVVTDYQGSWVSFAMSKTDYDALPVLPTHESVADVPRRIVQ